MVTIDDLDALLELLKKHPAVSGNVVVQCDEGVFTEGEDMRKLSDQTLANLRIDVSGLVIHLSHTQAEAIGPEELVDSVAQTWARSRQTRERPTSSASNLPAFFAMALLAVALGGPSVVGAWRLASGGYQDDVMGYGDVAGPLTYMATLVALTFGIITIFAAMTAVRAWRTHRAATWAVNKPFTQQEIRERVAQRTRVPLWSLMVSILALVVSIVFNAYNVLAR